MKWEKKKKIERKKKFEKKKIPNPSSTTKENLNFSSIFMLLLLWHAQPLGVKDVLNQNT